VHLIIEIYFSAEFKELRPDAFFVDQLSAGLPLLRYLWPDTPILFYCHFPDLLLAKGRSRLLKRLYRRPFDWLEQWSMGFADAVVVNSEFTKAVVSDVWPQLAKNKKLEVVYPCVNVRERGLDDEDGGVMWQGKDIVLSINRFEEKKNIELAIEAYGGLGRQGQKGSRLVIAGGPPQLHNPQV
jgi:alpha-1,3/alpha-1,6-mannosyltransferase